MYNKLTLSGKKITSPLSLIDTSHFIKHKVNFWLKRDELLDSEISGNKWRKLKYNLQEARNQGKSTLLSYGGAYSNHLHAVAAAGKRFGFRTVFLVRGEAPAKPGPTLRYARSAGTRLHFCSRSQYRDQAYREKFSGQFGDDVYVLPEGGSNALAITGCIEIIDELRIQQPDLPDYLCLSAGTGATAAGVIAGLQGQSEVLVFPALKGAGLEKDISAMLKKYTGNEYTNWQCIKDYHFGGYARYKPELIAFINNFKTHSGIALDPVYTGKMAFGIFDQIKKGFIPPGSRIAAIHTGGLQGIAGFNERFGKLIY